MEGKNKNEIDSVYPPTNLISLLGNMLSES